MKPYALSDYFSLTEEQRKSLPKDAVFVQGGVAEFDSIDRTQQAFDAEIAAAGGIEAWRAQHKNDLPSAA